MHLQIPKQMASIIFDSIPSNVSCSIANHSNIALAGSLIDETVGNHPAFLIITHQENKLSSSAASVNDKIFESLMSMSNPRDTIQKSKRRKSDSCAIHTLPDISEPELSTQLARLKTEFRRRGSCMLQTIHEGHKNDEQRSFSRGSL